MDEQTKKILILTSVIGVAVFFALTVASLTIRTIESNTLSQIQTSDTEMTDEIASEEELSFERDLYRVNEEDLQNHSDNLNIDETYELSQDEIDDLIFMREEEKLAHDVYTYLYGVWGESVFDNISNSEQKHTDSISTLIDSYGLSDPYLEGVGNYTNSDFSDLYKALTEQGSESLIAALKVGALIEDLDIVDLENAMERAENESIITVYENLQKGSRNHIRSFTDLLNRYGEEYTPEYLTESEYTEIITSPTERGGNSSGGGYKGGR